MARNYRLEAAGRPSRADSIQPRKVGTNWLSLNQPVGKKDVRLYRAWADQNEWIRAALFHRKTQVSQAPYDIGAINPDIGFDEALRTQIVMLFARPNPKTDSFRGLIEPVIEDLLVLDAGSIENVRNGKGMPAQLWQVDGAQIRLDPTWQGEPDKPRYYWYPIGPASVQVPSTRQGVGLLDSELIYLMQNPATWRVVGFSPLETLRETIESEIAASRYNKNQVLQAPPSGVVDLGEDASPENVDQFEKYWRTEIAGYKSTAVIGGTKNAKFIPFAKSNRDMQFLQWQTYLIRKITAVFGISPQDLGVTFDINRANASEQAQLSEDRGLKPLLHLLETQFNREIVGEFARTKAKSLYYRGDISMADLRMAMGLTYLDPRDNRELYVNMLSKTADKAANAINLYFHFRVPSGRSTAARADTHKLELGGVPWTTINEARDEELKGKVDGGDEIILPTPMGPIRLSTITGMTLPNPVEKAFLEYALRNAPVSVVV